MINPNLYSPFKKKRSDEIVVENVNKEEIKSSFLAKVFLYFGVELLLTALLTLGFSFLLDYFLPFGVISERSSFIYGIILIVSFIGLLITLVIVQRKTLVKEKGGYIATFIHCLFVSLLLSAFGYLVGSKELLALSVAITSILFLIMCAFGLLIKNKYGWLVGLAIGLIVTSSFLILINYFLLQFLIVDSSLLEAYQTIYTVSNFILLIYSCIVTIIDVYRIKRMSKEGLVSNPIALYYSLLLYQDYIIILFYVFYILARNKSN